MATAAAERQDSHRDIWHAKAVLREVYGHLYRRLAAQCIPGTTIEVGGGSGNFKEFAPDCLSLDIVAAPWLDLVADAQALPFRAGSIANLVMLDVLHHIEYPLRFFREAVRVLAPGGRIVVVEPGITPLSRPVYGLLHEEPVEMAVDPLQDGVPDAGKDPYAGNQAIPTLLATRDSARLARAVPELAMVRRDWLSLAAYPLSGGFKHWTLLPASVARVVLRLEDALCPLVGRACGFRILVAWQRR